MFTTRFQILHLASMLIFFCAVAGFTRARARRIVGALCSVAVFTALSAPIDDFGIGHGWWSYPSCASPPHPSLITYVSQAFEFVGTIALIGWRVQRRFGARGVVWLTATVCIVGLIRDLLVAAALPRVVRFGPFPASAIADVAAWGIVVFVALAVTRVVAGAASKS